MLQNATVPWSLVKTPHQQRWPLLLISPNPSLEITREIRKTRTVDKFLSIYLILSPNDQIRYLDRLLSSIIICWPRTEVDLEAKMA